MRHEAGRAGLSLRIDSAGTGDWHIGEAPDPRAQAEARRNGLDISAYRGRQVTRADFHEFDLILALDAENLSNLRKLRPADGGARLALLLDQVPGRAGEAVADPYFGGEDGFAATWNDVSEAAHAIVEGIKAG
ncbi:phosphotyrosine protein phosphatase [Novosphingobium marinum]|nr:phosphotyrosine protein phosphatase [Novosphingobium marinum]